jgi:hypothetical protein
MMSLSRNETSIDDEGCAGGEFCALRRQVENCGGNLIGVAIFEHDRNLVTHRIENAPDVGVENAPIFRCSYLFERTLPFDASVVKCDVEPTEFLDRKINHRLHVGFFRDVCANEGGIASEFFDLPNEFCALFSRRPERTTFASARANAMAVALPMPEVPPVTSATLSENVLSLCILVLFPFVGLIVTDYQPQKLTADSYGWTELKS